MHKADREKLAFFAPDDRHYTFNVIPFGPTNTPPFYTATMKDLKDEWDTFFLVRITTLQTYNPEAMIVLSTRLVTIGVQPLIF